MKSKDFFRITLLFLFLVTPLMVAAQGSYHDYEETEANITVRPALLESLEFRSLNFSRGGRATAVAQGQQRAFADVHVFVLQ